MAGRVELYDLLGPFQPKTSDDSTTVKIGVSSPWESLYYFSVGRAVRTGMSC